MDNIFENRLYEITLESHFLSFPQRDTVVELQRTKSTRRSLTLSPWLEFDSSPFLLYEVLLPVYSSGR